MGRIVVLGCAGSGKTTFSRLLATRAGIPVICLDDIWQRDWTGADVPKFRQLVEAAHTGDRWISDGNFAAVTFDLRLPRADLIVWIDRPRMGCALRAVARVFRSGEQHKFRDLYKVLAFIRRFDVVNRPRIEAERLNHGAAVPVVRLTKRSEMDEFVRRFRSGN